MPSLLFVGHPYWQIGAARDLVVDDGIVNHRGADDPVAVVTKQTYQVIEARDRDNTCRHAPNRMELLPGGKGTTTLDRSPKVMSNRSMDVSARRRSGILLAIATAVISGFAVFVNGYGVRAWVEVTDTTTYTTLKNTFAALIILGVVGLRVKTTSSRIQLASLKRDQWWKLGAIAIFGGAIPFALFFEGLAQATSVQAAFIHKTLIIWVAILALVFLREKLGWPHVLAIGLLVWGQMVLVGNLGDVAFGRGELMILGATLMWSVEVVIAKKALMSVPSSTVAVFRMAGGALVLIGLLLVSGVGVDWAAVSSTHWMWIFVTGAFLAGYVLTWFEALSRAPAVDVTAVLVAGAVITAALQTSVRGVPLPDASGLVLLLAGAGVAFVASWRRRPRVGQ